MPYFVTINDDGTVTSGYEKKQSVYRAGKGHSLIDFPVDYSVVDLETTGYDPTYDEIIEICAYRVRAGQVVEKLCTLIKPSCPIDEYIIELTGITNEMVSYSPSIAEVLPAFSEFIGDDIVVGHNVSFDVNFIYDNQSAAGLPHIKNDYVDTMRISRMLFPEWPHHRLQDLARELLTGKYDSHRADADCEKTYLCLEKMRDIATERYGHANEFAKIYEAKKKKHHGKSYDINKIVATVENIDKSNPLYGKVCVFTGALERMVRKDAMQYVVNLGGICADSVTSKTNFLILGNNDYCSSIRDGKSSKQKKAEQLKLKGSDIEIITENVFYDILDDEEED